LHVVFDSQPQTDHNLDLIISNDGWLAPYWPIGLMAIVCLLSFFLIDWVYDKMRYKVYGNSLWKLECGFDNYWTALSTADRKWLELEE